MQIISSKVQLQSKHAVTEHSIEQERLRVWIDNPGNPPRQPADEGAARFRPNESTPDISPQAHAAQPHKKQGVISPETEASPTVKAKFLALIRFVERLTGKKIRIFDPKALQKNSVESPDIEPLRDSANTPARAGWGVEYDYYAARIEEEQTRFSAQGIVKTADGQTIDIELELGMSRRFMEEHRISIRAGDAEQRLKDPIVINFDGTAAELSETKFTFDLDADGREEQISMLSSNSGFLALDVNDDGIINNGSELFGTLSGNGFDDLTAYDEDGNQWIDEDDSIYSRLRIWTRDADGNNQLFALGQKDIGAIYLGNISTDFNLTTQDDNMLLGQVDSTSLFLKESGGVGTVQQLNLVV